MKNVMNGIGRGWRKGRLFEFDAPDPGPRIRGGGIRDRIERFDGGDAGMDRQPAADDEIGGAGNGIEIVGGRKANPLWRRAQKTAGGGNGGAAILGARWKPR